MKPLVHKHNFTTINHINNHLTLKLECKDLKKTMDYLPTLYAYFNCDIEYNVVLLTKTKKEKREVKNENYKDYVGYGDIKDLIQVKKLIDIYSTQLKTNEAIVIYGADSRRLKIYKYYIEKNFSNLNCVYMFSDKIVIINPLNLLGKYYYRKRTYDTKDYLCLKASVEKKLNKEWNNIKEV